MPRNEWRSVGDWRSPIVFSQCGDHLCSIFSIFRVWDSHSDCDCVKGPEDAALLPLLPAILIEFLPEFTRNLSSCIPKRGLIYSLSQDIHKRNGSNIFIKNTTIIRQGNRSNRFHIIYCYPFLCSQPI